jgi:nitroreductase
MEFIKLIENRHSKRSFHSDKEIPEEIIKSVINAARNAPSSKNTQPWSLIVIKGNKLNELRTLLLKKYDNGEFPEKSQYVNRPSTIPEEWNKRMEKTSEETYKIKNMNHKNKEDQHKHERENFTFFNAPLFCLILTAEHSVQGTFFDVGCFTQNLMLGFSAFGIGSCPQYSMTKFSKTISEFCEIKSDRIIVCGLSIGYPTNDSINELTPEREEMQEIVQWIE